MDWADLARQLIPMLFSGIVGGGIWGAIIAYRKDRREAPKDTADALDKLLRQTTTATSTAVAALEQSRQSKEKADEAEARAARAEKMVEVFRKVIITNVVHIIEWIDRGANPPPPVIQKELREFLEEVKGTELV